MKIPIKISIKTYRLTMAVTLSLMIHLILFSYFQGPKIKKTQTLNTEKKKINITSLRMSSRSSSLAVKKKPQEVHLKDLGLKYENQRLEVDPQTNSKKINDKKTISSNDFLDASGPKIGLNFLKQNNQDFLNSDDKIFYAFNKRVITLFSNSLKTEFNHFSSKHPNYDFSKLEKDQEILIQATFDKNGDILRIKTLKWIDQKLIQDFFMKVVQNIKALKNPPKKLIIDDQFSINFSLKI